MATKNRIAYLDKSKGLLIFLVVLGHFLEKYFGWLDNSVGPILRFIYLIHMPAFIFISGIFFNITKKSYYFYNYLSIFIVFQIAYVLFDFFIFDGQIFKWLNRPYWITWFLFTLSTYCLIAPMLLKFKNAIWIALFLSVYVGLISSDNYPYSIGRTCTFLPFFLIGIKYGQNILNCLNQVKYQFSVSIVVLILLSVISYFLTGIKPEWLYGIANIGHFSNDIFLAVSIKLGLFIISLIATISVVSFSKVLPNFFETLGANSLSIYLFHGFIVMLVNKYIAFHDDLILIIACFLLTLATCIIFKEKFWEAIIKRLSTKVFNIKSIL